MRRRAPSRPRARRRSASGRSTSASSRPTRPARSRPASMSPSSRARSASTSSRSRAVRSSSARRRRPSCIRGRRSGSTSTRTGCTCSTAPARTPPRCADRALRGGNPWPFCADEGEAVGGARGDGGLHRSTCAVALKARIWQISRVRAAAFRSRVRCSAWRSTCAELFTSRWACGRPWARSGMPITALCARASSPRSPRRST
jgi:hypothetical protein